MFKTRARKCEEEAKKEQEYEYIPTNELKADESDVPEEEKGKIMFPWTPVIIMGVLVALIIICVIVIMSVGGPINSSK